MSRIVLLGPLAHPAIARAIGLPGTPVPLTGHLTGHLTGGQRAGIDRDGWPALRDGADPLPALEVAETAALHRYAAIFGLVPRDWQGRRVLGTGGPSGDSPWRPEAWRADLAAEIARQIAHSAGAPDAIAARLPMIATWADSRLRAQGDRRSGGTLVPDRGPEAVQVEAIEQPHAGYFAIEAWRLRHRRHDGGWSPALRREGFISGDAVVVLPWDRARDRVLLIEQFRAAPAMRGDRQPWLLEAIAGRIDAGETPEAAARREAVEEAGLVLSDLIPAIHHYPSPGALGEYLYMFVAPADLPDDCAGVFGRSDEAEDIRGHLVPRDDLTRMALDGTISNGPLALLALWLAQRAGALAR